MLTTLQFPEGVEEGAKGKGEVVGEEEAEGMQTMVVEGEAEGRAGALREVVEAVEGGLTAFLLSPFCVFHEVLLLPTYPLSLRRN
jgi:hypothetical protein